MHPLFSRSHSSSLEAWSPLETIAQVRGTATGSPAASGHRWAQSLIGLPGELLHEARPEESKFLEGYISVSFSFLSCLLLGLVTELAQPRESRNVQQGAGLQLATCLAQLVFKPYRDHSSVSTTWPETNWLMFCLQLIRKSPPKCMQNINYCYQEIKHKQKTRKKTPYPSEISSTSGFTF